jgi:hypothetical protein
MGEMNPLRRRMIEDMTIRNLSQATQRSYVHAVLKFSQYFVARPTGSAWRMFDPIRCIWLRRASRGRR